MSALLLELPAGILEATQLTEDQLRIELAVTLYAQGKLSLGKAREVARLHFDEFLTELGARDIPVNYGVAELEADIATLKAIFP